MENSTLEAIKYNNGKLNILDQLLLPLETKYIAINGVEDGWKAINKMQVRGAPAIAIVGCLSLAVELYSDEYEDAKILQENIETKLNYLISARPTAVNMRNAAQDLKLLMKNMVDEKCMNATEIKLKFISAIEEMLVKDINDNKALGDIGAKAIADHIKSGDSARILTHCNTGSLATAGYGTALGVIRSLFNMKLLDHVFCTETRPYNQGARLTAYELVFEKIPATLIIDSMAGILMKNKNITAVIVGADRVAANGDTANKIGTYQLAVSAKFHKVPFYVAAPFTTVDFDIPNGDHIPIEERPEGEMTCIGEKRIAAPGISCWNPSFDVTPADLITGVITERGVFHPYELITKK